MATYTDVFSGRPYTLILEVTLDAVSGNSSRYDYVVKVKSNSGNGTWLLDDQDFKVVINGTTYTESHDMDFRPDSTGKTLTMGSGTTGYIAHNADGTKSFSVRCYVTTNGAFGSADTGTNTFTAARIPKAPGTPTALALGTTGTTTQVLTFSAPADNGGSAITSYTVQYATDSGFTTGTGTQNISSGGTITGLTNNTKYWFRVRANNAIGSSGYSSSVNRQTKPNAPTSFTAVASTSVTGRIDLAWTSPGGSEALTYNIIRDGVEVGTTSSPSYSDTGLTPHTSYTYTVTAENATYTGAATSSASATAPGPPSAPSGLTAGSVNPGEVDLSWTAPTTAGTGGITGYNIRLSDGTLVVATTGTGTTRTITGLTPGVLYTFKVSARNALADTEGTESAFSNTASATPVGEPGTPTGVSLTQSSTVSNRLTLSWTAPAGTLSGFNIFRRISGTDTLIAQVPSGFTSYDIDNLTAGTSYSYVVRARTAYTDALPTNGYPGNWGGPASTAGTATASVNNSQSVGTLNAVSSVTNAVFNGTFVINAITATTIRYAKTAANVPTAASGGSIANNTNAVFNGTFTIATPTTTTITFAKTNANIAVLATTGGLVTDLTNQLFNGTFTVTAVNVGANTLSYANTAANVAAAAVPPNTAPGQFGTVTNLSNAIFNGTGKVITAITEFTLQYAQTNANVAESNAAGYAIDATNRDVFNGSYVVSSIPAYNIVQYARTASNIAVRTWLDPNGLLYRAVSPALLDVQFRSGWSG